MKVFPETLITRCDECPHFINSEYLDDYICDHRAITWRKIVENKSLPDWCPLENKEEIQDSSIILKGQTVINRYGMEASIDLVSFKLNPYVGQTVDIIIIPPTESKQ